MAIKNKELKKVEYRILDLIKEIEVMNEEDSEAGIKKIEDETAEDLKERLRGIADNLSMK